MYVQNDYLEQRVKDSRQLDFKSSGERQIAYFLEDNSIRYQYEPGVLVNAHGGKRRIYYPDFYLPEFKTYIEYYGVTNNPAYTKGIKAKSSVYDQAGMDVIAMYPWMLKEDWQGYLMRALKRGTQDRYRRLMTKPYWSRNRNLGSGYARRTRYHRPRWARY